VIFEAGGKFDNREFRNRLITWFIKPEEITVKNSRANTIMECMHKVPGDMLQTQLASWYATENPVKYLLSAAAYALCATVHGVTSVSRDAIMLSQSTSEMCVHTSETVEVATDPEWALVLLLATSSSRIMRTKLTSYLLVLDKDLSHDGDTRMT
jgi:hypothetical protein